MISANGGLPVHRYTPQVTQGWPWGSEPASTRTAEASIGRRTDHTSAHPPDPKTTRGMEGTPTRGEQATPTEGAAGNAAARRTTTPSPPGDDPGRDKGHLTGTRRGRRHGHSDQG